MKPVCLITGAGGRLGSALCAALANEFEVIAVYRSRLPEVNSQLQQKLGPAPHDPVYCVQADLSEPADIRRVVEVAAARSGRVDVIVNAAADIRFHGNLREIWGKERLEEKQLLLNAVSPFWLVSAVHQLLWKDDADGNHRFNRNVVNISSVSGLYVGKPQGQGFYAASKASLNILSMHLASELAPYSVRVNTLCPGRFVSAEETALVVREVQRMISGSMTGMVTAAP